MLFNVTLYGKPLGLKLMRSRIYRQAKIVRCGGTRGGACDHASNIAERLRGRLRDRIDRRAQRRIKRIQS